MRPTHLQARYRYELTPRQREVMGYLERGLTNAEIADRLGLTLDGAKYHVREILGKLGAESREEAVGMWHEMPGRPRPWEQAGLAWMVAGAAATAMVVAAVVVAMVARDGGDESPPTDATAEMPTATVTAVPPTVSALAECTSLDVTLTLERLPSQESALLRLSASGTTPCRMSGPFTLGLIRPPVDPGPDYPPEANVARAMKVYLEFPFSGVIGEWTWRNWCAEPMPWVFWQAKAPGDSAPTVTLAGPPAGIVTDYWPTCLDPSQPTSLERETFVNGLEGDPIADPQCADTGSPEWLCTFATSVAGDAVAGREDLFPKRISNDVFFLCDGAGGAPGLPPSSDICASQPADTSVRGYWLSVAGDQPTFVDQPAFEDAVTLALPSSPSVAALGCLPLADFSCGYFVVVVVVGVQSPSVALMFRLEGGHEPKVIGAAILDEGPLPSSLQTAVGTFTLVPYPASP